jgi:hypothetical protein
VLGVRKRKKWRMVTEEDEDDEDGDSEDDEDDNMCWPKRAYHSENYYGHVFDAGEHRLCEPFCFLFSSMIADWQ